MEKSKVMLPREVADALEKALKWANGNHELVAWVIPTKEDSEDFWAVLFEYADERDNFYKIIDALRNGYEIEKPKTFTTNRKLDESEIRAIKKWYQGALLRIQDGTDPDEFAKEAIEEVALYLGGAELLKDIREGEQTKRVR